MAVLAKFRRAFHIDSKANLQNIAVAVESITRAYDVATQYLGDIDPQENSIGLRIHTLLNLLGRVLEHTQAMLVALATGSPASSEALARIVVEGSVNITYLATKGNAATLIQFFRTWLHEHQKKLEDWKKEISGTPYAPRVQAMIEERQQMVAGLGAYVDRVEEHCELKNARDVPHWPLRLFKRFEAVGRQTDYYQSYHRLSGASHITSEDTITWLLALDLPHEKQQQLSKEAWAYSVMMSRLAGTFFVDAALACVIAYGRTANDDLLECKAALAKGIMEIAPQAGVPMKQPDA